MALEDKMAPQQAQGDQGQALSPEDETDLKIAVLMAQQALDQGGFDVIEQAVAQSKDPGQVIGQFLMQLGQELHDNMPEGMELSPAIMLARGGWVEQVSDYISDEADIDKKIMDKAEIYVASTAQQMAQAKQQQSGGTINGVQAPPTPGPGAPVGGPPMPQGAM